MRGPRGPAARGRRERVGRRDLPHPAGAPRVSAQAAARRGRRGAVDAAALAATSSRALVRIPSVTGDEDDDRGVLADRLEAPGSRSRCSIPTRRTSATTPPGRARRCRARRCRSCSGGPGGRAAGGSCCRGHVDVVPPGDPATWTADPWAGEVRDGELYGRGANDMKGGVAAILGAVRALRAAGRARAGWTGSWSSRSCRPRRTAARGRSRRSGPGRPATSPSSPSRRCSTSSSRMPARSRSGSTVPGRAAHASRRTEGVSALDNLGDARPGPRGGRGVAQRARRPTR